MIALYCRQNRKKIQKERGYIIKGKWFRVFPIMSFSNKDKLN
jgi:hypothetical protein